MVPEGSRFILYLIFIMTPLFLTSCKKSSQKSLEKDSYVLALKEKFNLYEAKYSDIPKPVGYSLLNFVSRDKKQTDIGLLDNNSLAVSFLGDLPVQDATEFYRDNMERLGWDISDLSTEFEGLLFCRKSGRTCAVSIRPDLKKSKKGLSKSKVHIVLQKDLEIKSEDINSKGISNLNL
ncbi:hypothetical protein KAW80_03940 [Candidatus Babeliales bacterium]|nr:hypothetical protein [Candidatus Babeliales bacterium]